VVQTLASGAAFSAAVVLALYLNGDTVFQVYDNPQLLWPVVPLYIFWISRVLLIAHRGQMDEDPVTFVLKDPISLLTAVVVASIGILAI